METRLVCEKCPIELDPQTSRRAKQIGILKCVFCKTLLREVTDHDDTRLNRDAVVIRLCRLVDLVWKHIDPSGKKASDCFCREGYSAFNYCNDGLALEYLEKIVQDRIAKEAFEEISLRNDP